jgi:hypothetical protein
MAIDQRARPAADAAAAPQQRHALTAGLGFRDLALSSLALLALGVLVFLPHMRHGGFYLDDWSNAAGTLYPPGGGDGNAFKYFSELTLYRPVLVLYVPLTYLVLGTHMHLLLALAVALAVLVAVNLYAILRLLGVPRVHAWIICALTVVYPWYDSTRFWETADQATVALVFLTGGLWMALVGLRRGSLRLHVLAALLYLLSILTYEVALPLIAVLGGLYWLRAGWRAARLRWGMDLIAVVAGGLWVGLQTKRESRGLSADLTHLKQIVSSGGTLLGRTAIPWGEPATTLALVLIGAILLGGLCVVSWRRSLLADRFGASSWLLLAAAGLLVAALGWIMYIPANPYYTPSVYGFTNRVNALAGFGLVIAVYGTVGVLVATTAELLGSRAGKVAGVITAVLGLALGIAFVKVLERHGRIWDAAYRAEAAGISVFKTQFKSLAPETTLFVSNYPAYESLGVPIFSTGWDVNGMVELQYRQRSLAAYPLLPGLSIRCTTTTVSLAGPGAEGSENPVPYGHAQFLNVGSGHHVAPSNKRECESLSRSFVPGPLYLSTAY